MARLKPLSDGVTGIYLMTCSQIGTKPGTSTSGGIGIWGMDK